MLQNHHFWWRMLPKNELTRIYWSQALRYFAISLISLFVPLYLHIEIGFSINETLLFFVFYSIIFAIMTPIAGHFVSKYGMKHAVLFSVPFFLIYLLLLFALPKYDTPLLIIGLFLGTSLAFYWMGMNLMFYHASDKMHRGEEVGKNTSLSVFATMLGPFIGGILIKYIGFQFVFGISSILLIGASFLLFIAKDIQLEYNHFNVKNLFKKDDWRMSTYFFSKGINVMATGVIWPLFIFTILKDYLSLGVVGSLLSLISAILIYLIGRFSDRVGKRKIIRFGVGFETLAWILRSMVQTVTQVFGATIFGAITIGIIQSPMIALEFDNVNHGVVDYFVKREIFLCLGRALVCLIVIMLGSLKFGLILTGVSALSALLI